MYGFFFSTVVGVSVCIQLPLETLLRIGVFFSFSSYYVTLFSLQICRAESMFPYRGRSYVTYTQHEDTDMIRSVKVFHANSDTVWGQTNFLPRDVMLDLLNPPRQPHERCSKVRLEHQGHRMSAIDMVQSLLAHIHERKPTPLIRGFRPLGDDQDQDISGWQIMEIKCSPFFVSFVRNGSTSQFVCIILWYNFLKYFAFQVVRVTVEYLGFAFYFSFFFSLFSSSLARVHQLKSYCFYCGFCSLLVCPDLFFKDSGGSDIRRPIFKADTHLRASEFSQRNL